MAVIATPKHGEVKFGVAITKPRTAIPPFAATPYPEVVLVGNHMIERSPATHTSAVRRDASVARQVAARRVDSFRGWKVLVTGGSSGIGLELARQLVEEGAHVCIAARDRTRLIAARDSLCRVPSGAEAAPSFLELDVTSPQAIAAAIPRVVGMLGGLDWLVNNAGYAQTGYIDELKDDVYRDMMDVNYYGPMRLCRAVLPHFRAQGYGRILNVTSLLGFMGAFGYSAYSASKYALAGFTECLRQDVLPFNIRVHLSFPPTTHTPGLIRENQDKPPEAWAIEGKSKILMPEQVASAMLRGVRRGRFHLLAGFDSWFIWFMQRLAPGLVRGVVDSVLLKARRAQTALPAAADPVATDPAGAHPETADPSTP